LGILRMDYPVGFSPTELFMPASDLPFILPTGATNIVLAIILMGWMFS